MVNIQDYVCQNSRKTRDLPLGVVVDTGDDKETPFGYNGVTNVQVLDVDGRPRQRREQGIARAAVEIHVGQR